jgi:hypothetical protein
MDANVEKLVEEILRDPEKYREEAKLLLRLSKWSRQGQSFVDEADYEVVKGEVEEIVLREWDEGYPYRRGKDIVLIPLQVPTVVVYKIHYDYGTETGKRIKVHVFTTDGWKSVDVN